MSNQGVGKRLTPEAVEASRLEIRARLGEANAESERSGKPLQIIVGESHQDYRSFLNAMLVIDEAQRLGVKTIGLEAGSIFTPKPGTPVVASNIPAIESIGMFFPGMRSEKIDTARGLLDINDAANPEKFEARNVAMAANIADNKTGTVALVGAAHIKGIAENPALKDSVVVQFNANEYSAPIQSVYPHAQEGMDYALSNKVHQIDPVGDAREHSYGEVVKLALGEKRGGDRLAQLEARGLITSPKGIERQIPKLEGQLKDPQSKAFAEISLANAHRDLGAATGSAEQLGKSAEYYAGIYNRNPSEYMLGPMFNAPQSVRETLGLKNDIGEHSKPKSFGDMVGDFFKGFSFGGQQVDGAPTDVPSQSHTLPKERPQQPERGARTPH